MLVQNKSNNSAASIVLRIASGDRTAEKELVDTYYRGLFFILSRQTKNTPLAEDLVQDTFIIVIQKARRNEIKNPEKIKAFIRQTGINLLIDSTRKEKRRATYTDEDIDVHAPANEAGISKLLHSSKLLSVTTQLIGELKTSRDKDILRYYFIYDKQKSEICQALDLTPEHFDKVLFRARHRLKQLIQHKLNQVSDKQGHPSNSSLLTFVALLSFYFSNHPVNSTSIIFSTKVRESVNSYHLSNETLETDSRYLLVLIKSKSLTSMRRGV